MFQGFVALESTFVLYIQVTTSARTPVAPDAAPTFKVFLGSAELSALAGTSVAVSAVTGLYKVSIACTAANGLAAGQTVVVRSVGAISSTGWSSLDSFGVC